jgi:hypothetical protein
MRLNEGAAEMRLLFVLGNHSFMAKAFFHLIPIVMHGLIMVVVIIVRVMMVIRVIMMMRGMIIMLTVRMITRSVEWLR